MDKTNWTYQWVVLEGEMSDSWEVTLDVLQELLRQILLVVSLVILADKFGLCLLVS